MILIVGLGNPGKKYKKTRHNVGFLALDFIAETDKWQESKNANCLYIHSQISGKNVELAKPLTFMNNSGKCVKYIVRKHNINPRDIMVTHDDIDLPLGTIRISKNISSAGHKGVQSIIDELKTKNFTRIRIGILPKTGKPQDVEKFVLQKFTKEEEKNIKKVIEKAVKIIISIPYPTHERQIFLQE